MSRSRPFLLFVLVAACLKRLLAVRPEKVLPGSMQKAIIRLHMHKGPPAVISQSRVHMLQLSLWVFNLRAHDCIHDVCACEVGCDNSITALHADQPAALRMHQELQLIEALPRAIALPLRLQQILHQQAKGSLQWHGPCM